MNTQQAIQGIGQDIENLQRALEALKSLETVIMVKSMNLSLDYVLRQATLTLENRRRDARCAATVGSLPDEVAARLQGEMSKADRIISRINDCLHILRTVEDDEHVVAPTASDGVDEDVRNVVRHLEVTGQFWKLDPRPGTMAERDYSGHASGDEGRIWIGRRLLTHGHCFVAVFEGQAGRSFPLCNTRGELLSWGTVGEAIEGVEAWIVARDVKS